MKLENFALKIFLTPIKQEELEKVAEYCPGKTWKDFVDAYNAGKRASSSRKKENRVVALANKLRTVIIMKGNQ